MPDRYLEIFELNRDVLASPDLLPIGRQLKIPPRRRGTSAIGSGRASSTPPAEYDRTPPVVDLPDEDAAGDARNTAR